MKKWFFLALCSLVVSTLTFAQDEDSSSYIEPQPYTYCELVGLQRAFSNKVTVEIDYGQENKLFRNDQRIMDRRTGRPKVFNSMIDAMNSMGEIGWEFVQAYVLIAGSQNEIHYILKRAITDEEKKRLVPTTRGDVLKRRN